jgi:hypothetical protein
MKIKYEEKGVISKTKCPYEEKQYIGNHYCKNKCSFFRGNDKKNKTIECIYEHVQDMFLI